MRAQVFGRFQPELTSSMYRPRLTRIGRACCRIPWLIFMSQENIDGGEMAIPRDLAIERRQQSGPQFSEPVERRGNWNDGSLTAAARRAWDRQQLGVLLDGNEKTVARGLGWFSIGLGLAEVLAPRT